PLPAPRSVDKLSSSLPLDGAGRLGGDVVHHAVDAPHLVHHAAGDAIEQVVRHAVPIGGHEVGGRNGADGGHVLGGSFTCHAAEAAHRQEGGEGLRYVAIEIRPADLVDDDVVGVLENLHALGVHFA